MNDTERKYWEAKRSHIIDELAHIEAMLGMERTIPPRHKQKRVKDIFRDSKAEAKILGKQFPILDL